MVDKKSKQKQRQDNEKARSLKVVNKKSKQRQRQDANKWRHEKELKQQSRQHETKGPLLKRVDTKSTQKQRQGNEKAPSLKVVDKKSKQKQRQDANKLRHEKELKQQARANEEKGPNQHLSDLHSKRKRRKDSEFREAERLAKANKRRNTKHRQLENDINQRSKRIKRKSTEYGTQEEARKKRKHGNDLNESITRFHKAISSGPVYVCTCCHQTWFKHSVYSVNSVKNIDVDSIKHFLTNGEEWICNTCLRTIKSGKTPALATVNKNMFPVKPEELELHQLERKTCVTAYSIHANKRIAKRLSTVYQRECCKCAYRHSARNQHTPKKARCYANVTVPVKLKKRMCYKSCAFTENIRPQTFINALNWLLINSDLFKDSGSMATNI